MPGSTPGGPTIFFAVNSHVPASHLPFHTAHNLLFNELHARPFPVLSQGTRVSQLALLHQGQTREAEVHHLTKLCLHLGFPPPANSLACQHLDFGQFELRWERHTEFSTYTVIHNEKAAPFSSPALSLLPNTWLTQLPGKIISGVHIEIHALPARAPDPDSVRKYFDGHRLISSWVIDKKARLWSAFRLHNDSMGRVLIQNSSLNPCQLGRLVRRLLELETYRMMLLLAFPMARQMAPALSAMDAQLATITEEINAIRGLGDERRLLSSLSTLAAEIEHLRSQSNFRFAAARAYQELVQNRLTELREQEESGLQTFGEFLPRRLTPAFRTCEAAASQLDDLARRIDRASELLRTRIDLTLEEQNQALLLAMNQRSQVQLKLQQAVEGLSVVAISYYLVGLMKYAAESLHEMHMLSHPALITGASVPVCVFLVWRGMRRLRHNLGQ